MDSLEISKVVWLIVLVGGLAYGIITDLPRYVCQGFEGRVLHEAPGKGISVRLLESGLVRVSRMKW